MQLHLLSRSWMVPHSSHWHPVRQHERQGLIRTRKIRKLKKPREEEEKRGEKREGECRRGCELHWREARVGERRHNDVHLY